MDVERRIEAKLKETGWDYELLPRHGRWILSIYRDEFPVGSIQLDSEADAQLWSMIMQSIDNPLLISEIQKLIPQK